MYIKQFTITTSMALQRYLLVSEMSSVPFTSDITGSTVDPNYVIFSSPFYYATFLECLFRFSSNR